MQQRLVTLCIAAWVASGCTIHPPYQRPIVELPGTWSGTAKLSNTFAEPAEHHWWRAFNDRTLNLLQDTVLSGSYDARAAMRRIMQARASARAIDANKAPAFSGGLGVERTRSFGGGTPQNAFSIDAGVTYEPDLWDRFGNLSRVAMAVIDNAVEGERAVKLVLSTDTASAYFQLAGVAQRIEVVQRSITVAERIDAIIEARYKEGGVSGLDRAQSKTNLASIRATLPALEQRQHEALSTLAVLAGRQPGTFVVPPPRLTDVALPARIPVGLPSDLLQRRPDIRQAESNLAAAHADIGVARANLFPSLQLTADSGFASSQLSQLLRSSNGFLSVGAALLSPIFQADRLRALTDRASERHLELVQIYQQTILGALRDVENALSGMERLAQQEAIQEEVIQHAGRAFELAEIRYRSGLTDVINLLSTQNTLLNAEDAYLQTRLARINALVNLYRGLGGGFV